MTDSTQFVLSTLLVPYYSIIESDGIVDDLAYSQVYLRDYYRNFNMYSSALFLAASLPRPRPTKRPHFRSLSCVAHMIKVACGRHHSIALARPRRRHRSAATTAVASTAVASTAAAAKRDSPPEATQDNADTRAEANVIYTWGRASCGRLGRAAPPPPSSLLTAGTARPSLNHSPRRSTRRSSTRVGKNKLGRDVKADNGVGKGKGLGGGGSSSGGGAWSADTDEGPAGRSAGGGTKGVKDKDTTLSQQQQRDEGRELGSRCASRPDAFNMPAVVLKDWSYRVNDHRIQGAPLVAPVGASVAACAGGGGGSSSSERDSGDGASASQKVAAVTATAATDAVGVTARQCCAGSSHASRGPVSIAAGWRHSVAVTEEGAVFVWGCGAEGRLGSGSHADVETPQQVSSRRAL